MGGHDKHDTRKWTLLDSGANLSLFCLHVMYDVAASYKNLQAESSLSEIANAFKGSHHLKKSYFMKKFHKTVTPPMGFMKAYFFAIFWSIYNEK